MKDKIIENLQSTDKSPRYYRYYLRLFYKYFGEVDTNKIDELSDAGYYYYHSVLLMDAIIDNKKIANIPLISLLQEETVKTLTAVFGKNSEFWDYWNARKHEFMEAVQIEKELQTQKLVKQTAYQDLADKKSTFGKIAIDCLYLLTGKKETQIYRLLLKSHYYFSVGFQLYDDVKDFKEDFEKGQFNWAIYQLKKKIDFDRFQNDVNRLNKYLYLEGVASSLLHRSAQAFQKALDILKPLNIDSEWVGVIKDMKNTILSYSDITEGYIKVCETKAKFGHRRIAKNRFFSIDGISNFVLKAGLNYIKKDYLHDYAELKHIMYLSRKEDFENTTPIHISDIFQRALLDDCLLSFAPTQHLAMSSYIDAEIMYLIQRVNEDATGGWSYFPSVKEIAADIDDLGQMMQLFIHANKMDYMDKYCLTPIQIALNNKYNKEGGIATWIIPNDNHTPRQEKQDLFNRTKWGTGPDTEVVANFVYALHLYHPETYRDVVEKAMPFICCNQDENGFWESRWYYGTYYGTYICLRLLKEKGETYWANIQKALDFLICNQQESGGFGLDNQSPDALSTALALLSFKLFLDEENINVRKAMNYLLDSQQQDGSWTSVDFIKPKASEPYKSKVLTTALVLKSLFL
ncbi:MAG: terpene cyclase/mutase family protein [Candidatus Symbiothrix sp.]|jgi:hypothetical protein|nr:terpene cyclase/mutase family protein [Candidatus Symbiothrix sp.]